MASRLPGLRSGGALLRVAAALALILASGAPPAHAQNQPDFFGLGDLAGGAVSSGAHAVSADGLVVVGESESGNGTEAFRWTAGGGMAGLGTLSGGDFFSSATGVSADGSVVAGTASNSDGGTGFRWTSGGGMVGLGQLGCSLCGASPALANGVSPDGQVAVGSATHKTLFGDIHADAVRWAGGGTSSSILATPSGGGTGNTGGHAQAAQGTDADQTGAVLVGDSEVGGDPVAVVWTGGGSSVSVLPQVGGALTNATALAISADASTIVGATNSSSVMSTSLEAARWDGPGWGTLTLLGDLGATSPRSRAWDVTSDGARIVGTARDAGGTDRAFLWDATNGMRDLATVLLDDYGVDVGGWVLSEARGISDPNGQGEFAIVGLGTNPDGDEEAWYAFLSPVACNDGLDDDLDGHVDFPDDPECNRKSDRSEIEDCADGLDNDGDGLVDAGADPGCNDAADPSEEPDCSDGLDDDGDGLVDFPADPGCRTGGHPIEDPACNNGLDDDGNGAIDYPNDANCLAPDDFSELRDCDDGIDNDFDGLVDFPADPDCKSLNDGAEDPQCNDRLDNDADGRIDYPDAYPACTSPDDGVERGQCADGVDNDLDGLTDYPADIGCVNGAFPTEAPRFLSAGELLVLDRASRSLFGLDPGTGAQTLVSQGAQWTAPQGVAVRSTGEVVVIDETGLYDVTTVTGVQRRMSDPIVGKESLQVVVDGTGDLVVLGADELWTADWTGNYALVVPTSLLKLPVDVSLAWFRGDSLARESDGKLLVSAYGFTGEGVFRIDPSVVPPTYEQVSPVLATDRFTDLAVESDGTILAVGQRISTGEVGVFRVEPSGPSMGSTTTLSADPAWVSPVAVAVAANGDIFVGDEGTCTGGVCTGAQVVRVDPLSGARLDVWSGGSITGPVDLAIVSDVPDCADGLDDDGDLLVDFGVDGGCTSWWDVSEQPDCSDGLDNDGDGATDFPADPGCKQAGSWRENPQCSDGLDNDGDGFIDLDDPQCGLPSGPRELLQARHCGLLGAEVLPLLAWLARRRRAHSA